MIINSKPFLKNIPQFACKGKEWGVFYEVKISSTF